MSEHSIIPPSSAHIWGKRDGCTGWVKMAEMYPETEDSEAAAEGTKAHELSESLMFGNYVDLSQYDAEMVEGAQMYVEAVRSIIPVSATLGTDWGIETKVKAVGVHEKSFGTVDAWYYDKVNDVLYIWDFKFGHTAVEVYKNMQLVNYFVGLSCLINRAPASVRFCIVQPRAQHSDGKIRTWWTTSDELMPLMRDLRQNAEIALSDKAALNAGSHCKYCQARHACKALSVASMFAADEALKPQKYDLKNEELGRELDILKHASELIKYRISGLEAQAENKLKTGQVVPGYGLKEGRGSIRWNVPKESINELGDLLGVKIRKEESLTPLQAKKAGLSEEIFNALTVRKPGKMKLEQIDKEKIKEKFNV